MSESRNSKSAASKVPTLTAYHVRDNKGGECIWMRIGIANQQSESTEISVEIETIPLDGCISLRITSAKSG